MAEYIGLLKTASLFVAVLGFLLVCLSAFIVWKHDLLDYYRFKTGKGKKKISEVERPKTISQYYSETLDESDSHEIINQEYGQDSGDLVDSVTIGKNANGEVQQVIDDEIADFTLKNRQTSIPLPEGTEETTLLSQDIHSAPKLYVPISSEDAYEDDNGIDETDIIALQKPDFEEVYEVDNNIDETDIIQISQFNEDEGSEETQLLSENLDETDAISIEFSNESIKTESASKEFDLHIKNKEAFLGRKLTAAEITLEKLEFSSLKSSVKTKEEAVISLQEVSKEDSAPVDSDETELLQHDSRGNNQMDLDGSDETELLSQSTQGDDTTEDLSKEQKTSVLDDEATTLFIDEDGDAETTVLSQQNKENQLSLKLWAKQTTTFTIPENSDLVVTTIKRKK